MSEQVRARIKKQWRDGLAVNADDRIVHDEPGGAFAWRESETPGGSRHRVRRISVNDQFESRITLRDGSELVTEWDLSGPTGEVLRCDRVYPDGRVEPQ
jgi:hypothetical protein